MKRRYSLPILLTLGLLAGCASMSKKECETADWQALGYSDGSRGIDYSNLEKRRGSCSKYQIAPDDNAYRAGWDQGIRRYCTADTGFRIGGAGQPFPNICPPDVEPAFLSGWQQGVRQYCVPENALQLGLGGYPYRGVCPADVAGIFQDFYRLGLDVRQARAVHHEFERQEGQVEQALAVEQDPGQYRKLLHELARLRHEENRSDAALIALEACMNGDWYDAGYRDGEAGNPDRTHEIAGICGNYGIAADRPGYRDGWLQGNGLYCSYDTGLYVGQSNQEYLGVCSGYGHQQFWRGYQQGRHLFEEGRYEAHPRPAGHQPPQLRQPERRAEPRQPGAWQPIRPEPARRQPMPQRKIEPRQQPPMQQPQRPAMEKKPQPERPMERRPQPAQEIKRQPPRATPAQPAQPAARQPAVPAQPSTAAPQPAPQRPAAKTAESKAKNGGKTTKQEPDNERERRLKELQQREADQPARATPAARP